MVVSIEETSEYGILFWILTYRALRLHIQCCFDVLLEHLQWTASDRLADSQRWPVRSPNHCNRRAWNRLENRRALADSWALAEALADPLAAIVGW